MFAFLVILRGAAKRLSPDILLYQLIILYLKPIISARKNGRFARIGSRALTVGVVSGHITMHRYDVDYNSHP